MGLVLFVFFINVLPDTIQSSLYLFANDTKVFSLLISSHKANKFKQDLVELHLRTEKWLLSGHPDKCVLMLLGKNNYNCDFYLPSSREPPRIAIQEKDLGVIFDDKLSFSIHISEQVSKANRIMGDIRISFTALNNDNFWNLFKGLMRSKNTSGYFSLYIDNISITTYST